ncbi:hypothetical protein AB0M48_22065 [Lentzea sp. NPDC051208]|uniref:hypothetical protein n=1 Tax=Lentzea sp. NPDC051208 TaxID=3154642 RepID=UPI0034220C5C
MNDLVWSRVSVLRYRQEMPRRIMLARSAWPVPSRVTYRDTVNRASIRFNRDEFVGVQAISTLSAPDRPLTHPPIAPRGQVWTRLSQPIAPRADVCGSSAAGAAAPERDPGACHPACLLVPVVRVAGPFRFSLR